MSQVHEPTFSVPNINLGGINYPHNVILNVTSVPDKDSVGQKLVYNVDLHKFWLFNLTFCKVIINFFPSKLLKSASNTARCGCLYFPHFRTCCWKLAQCGWVSNTVSRNIAGNLARCECSLTGLLQRLLNWLLIT